MTKSDLIVALAKKENIPETLADQIVNMLFNGFTEAIKKGERIEIRGFGSFAVREYGAYKGRNPRTGKSVKVKAKKLPYFKVGKDLKEMVDR